MVVGFMWTGLERSKEAGVGAGHGALGTCAYWTRSPLSFFIYVPFPCPFGASSVSSLPPLVFFSFLFISVSSSVRRGAVQRSLEFLVRCTRPAHQYEHDGRYGGVGLGHFGESDVKQRLTRGLSVAFGPPDRRDARHPLLPRDCGREGQANDPKLSKDRCISFRNREVSTVAKLVDLVSVQTCHVLRA